MTPAPFELEDLVARSRESTGLHDFGGDDVFDSLRVLTKALNEEAYLTPAGAAGKRAALLRGLGNRLKIQQALTQHPEITEQKISGPLVIVGLPRSGTTKLHRIIAADPGMQSLPLWKILNPLPLADAQHPAGMDPRIAIAEAFEAAMRETQPVLHAAHPMLAREPDEDVFALEFTGRGYINSSAFRAPSYQAWLDAQPFEPWYAWLKKLLQVIQFFDHGAGRPWVLKAPQHMGFLPLLFEQFPDATLIHCHRDPQVCIASFATMLLGARTSTSDRVDTAEVGQYSLGLYRRLMGRYLNDRPALETTHRFLDIRYDDIVQNGIATVQRIYRTAGLKFTGAASAALRQWEAANSQHKNGRHSYHLADTGLSANQVSEAFAAYSDSFAAFFAMNTTASLEAPRSGETLTRLLAELQSIDGFVRKDPRANTPLLQAEASRYVLRVLDGMLLTGLAIADPDYPRLIRLFDTYRHSGNANPDCVYLYARISVAHTYRIHGTRGTSRLMELQTMDGDFIAGPNHKGLVTLTDLAADADGNIEIILSATPHEGNWVRLDATARWLYLRQYYYDWETEVPASLTIEREGALLPPPLLPPAELTARLERITGFVPSWFRHLANFAGRYYDAPADALTFLPSPSGMAGLLYGKGHFQLGADAALVLEFLPPASPYWSFQIMNHFWEALDFDVRQTSLNGHQAQLDPDGMFRAVISLTDPGVPNWLDPCGHANGLICCRVLRPEHLPAVSLRVVPLSALVDALHPDTPATTPQQRHATLRRRMLGFQRRYRE